jgi:hypothetical protein
LIEISTGFNYAETYARPFINQKLSFDKNIMKRAWVMRHTVSLSIEGVLGSIQFNSPVLIEKIVPISLAGDMITESPFGRIALLFLKSNSEEELLGLYRKTLDRSLYTINNTH